MSEALEPDVLLCLLSKSDDGGRYFLRNIGTYLLTIDHHLSEDHKFDIFTLTRTSVSLPVPVRLTRSEFLSFLHESANSREASLLCD
jgi:hypothetical protein